MTGRVILITGGNSGIGFEAAKYLCEGGNDVVLACRNKDKGQEAVNKILSELPNSLVQYMQVIGIRYLVEAAPDNLLRHDVT